MVLSIMMAAVLKEGDESYSHTLNLVERYLPLLMDLGNTAAARRRLLSSPFSRAIALPCLARG